MVAIDCPPYVTNVPEREERRRRLRGVATGEQIVDHAAARRTDQRRHGAIAADGTDGENMRREKVGIETVVPHLQSIGKYLGHSNITMFCGLF